MTIKATAYDLGNGLPDVGDYIATSDQLYIVEAHTSRISTNQPGVGNSLRVELKECDWDDCAEEDEHRCLVRLT
jgi:hypothetical protein